jgi:hypothetical protein
MTDICTKCGRQIPDWSQTCGCAPSTPPATAHPATSSGPLRSSDGAFACAPDDAVQIAYMMNLAEGLMHGPDAPDRLWLSELLLSYLDGSTSIEDAIAELRTLATEQVG